MVNQLAESNNLSFETISMQIMEEKETKWDHILDSTTHCISYKKIDINMTSILISSWNGSPTLLWSTS